MRRGKENAFGDREILFVFHRKRRRPRMAYGACYLKGTRFFDRGEFRLGPGKRWQQQKGRGPCSCCARPLLSQWGSSIASMILGALAAMAQTKVKRLLAHSSIGHVGYIRTGFSCGTIEGIQSLLIGIFIYALMTIDAFAIVLALRQTRVKYIADLGALAKTNPISAITFSITMFSYAGIPPLAGFCSKFYLFFAALGCGAYFLAPVGVVTSVIGRWAAGRLPRVSQFGGPKAVLRAPDT
ncbi:proton antipo M domain-containing protein [Citrus sinensis]|uniref:Proton antipo M domain-containing protein n=1 Tax=Citrus sinensis TaxID=2711 RepID=A0ACB8HZ82_CITSI|nr:proton antipo M domain-containing protein [Citrus sinensis]